MKKSLLSLAVIAALGANAQTPTVHNEKMDGVTPCFLSWTPAGAFQGSAGHDFTNMTWNSSDGDGVMEFAATTHAASHGPLYYTLSSGDDLSCDPAKGAVDVSDSKAYVEVRMKASTPMAINLYIQEGNAPSWDYSKFSESNVKMELTTSYQVFKLENLSTANLAATGTVDLTNIGAVIFELGKTNDTDFDQVSGATVSVDYIFLGYDVSVNENVVNALNVYPNPATDQLNVAFDATSVSTVELTDLTGKVIATQIAKVGANTVSFETSNVNAGVYFVNIKNATGNVTQKVIIK